MDSMNLPALSSSLITSPLSFKSWMWSWVEIGGFSYFMPKSKKKALQDAHVNRGVQGIDVSKVIIC